MATIVGTNGNDPNLNGAGEQDYIFGKDGADTLSGFGNDDQLFGGSGQDRLFGGSGNDRLKGGLGNDLLDGGAGNDTADYSNATIDPPGAVGPILTVGATAGVTVNLNLTGAQNTGGAGLDTLVGIENLTGTNFSDILTGNGANNVLTGGNGDDTLQGGGGNDRLFGGSGNDRLTGGTGADLLDGGAGVDTASYAGATAGVRVTLDNGMGQATGGAGTDQLVSIENLIGSNFNDQLISLFGGSTFNGENGNDVISVQDFEGTANGGAGDDELETDSGAGTFNGGAGNDRLTATHDHGSTLNGGAGNDRLEVSNPHGSPTLTGGAGADTFIYSSTEGGFDQIVITDFAGAGAAIGDRIDLRPIDANGNPDDGNQAFVFGGPFTAGHLRYNTTTGVLSGNTDGDAAAEFEIQLVGAPTLFVQAGNPGSDILL